MTFAFVLNAPFGLNAPVCLMSYFSLSQNRLIALETAFHFQAHGSIVSCADSLVADFNTIDSFQEWADLRMASTQRPRPRARKATVDAVNGSTIESVRSFHRTPSAPNRVIVDVDGEDDNDDDDDDDEFFTRKKVTKAPKAREIAARTQSAPTFDHSEDYFSKEDREEVGFDEEHNLGSSDSDGEGRRRKRLRQNLPLWTKTASYSKIELSSRQPSSSQERVIEEGSTVLGRLEKSSSRSPSLTLPPALEQEGMSQEPSMKCCLA